MDPTNWSLLSVSLFPRGKQPRSPFTGFYFKQLSGKRKLIRVYFDIYIIFRIKYPNVSGTSFLNICWFSNVFKLQLKLLLMRGSLPPWVWSPVGVCLHRGPWHTAWLCQCGRGCVGVVAPLCRISTPVHPPPNSSYTQPSAYTLLSCSVDDTTYCLPPTGVNLSTVRRCQIQSLPSHSCLPLVCVRLLPCASCKEKAV